MTWSTNNSHPAKAARQAPHNFYFVVDLFTPQLRFQKRNLAVEFDCLFISILEFSYADNLFHTAKTVDGDHLFLYKGTYSNRQHSTKQIFIFASRFQLEVERKSGLVFLGDGSFQSVPAKFKHTYSLRTMIEGSVFPVAFALMEEKTAQAYEMVF